MSALTRPKRARLRVLGFITKLQRGSRRRELIREYAKSFDSDVDGWSALRCGGGRQQQCSASRYKLGCGGWLNSGTTARRLATAVAQGPGSNQASFIHNVFGVPPN